MKIREFLEAKVVAAAQARLDRLVELGAPKVVVEAQEARVAKGASTIGHLKELGDLEILASEPGKKYRYGVGVNFETSEGVIRLIPGPYGLFLVKGEGDA